VAWDAIAVLLATPAMLERRKGLSFFRFTVDDKEEEEEEEEEEGGGGGRGEEKEKGERRRGKEWTEKTLSHIETTRFVPNREVSLLWRSSNTKGPESILNRGFLYREDH
jgi:hypothetical protein